MSLGSPPPRKREQALSPLHHHGPSHPRQTGPGTPQSRETGLGWPGAQFSSRKSGWTGDLIASSAIYCADTRHLPSCGREVPAQQPHQPPCSLSPLLPAGSPGSAGESFSLLPWAEGWEGKNNEQWGSKEEWMKWGLRRKSSIHRSVSKERNILAILRKFEEDLLSQGSRPMQPVMTTNNGLRRESVKDFITLYSYWFSVSHMHYEL
nr:uncharacterized protein LOC112544710 [Pelodiscus sinensis]|eukprot:XP_025037181.1 uncharacterized protein LOC112544710 [Pelodiscus sinensis]